MVTYCYGPALNLSHETIKCIRYHDTAFEISKLICLSPRHNAAFDYIKVENTAIEGPNADIRTLFVQQDGQFIFTDPIACIIEVWDECRETKDARMRAIGVQTQMSKCNILFIMQLCKKILIISDNLTKTFEKHSMSAAGQGIAEMSVETLKCMHDGESFNLFYDLVNKSHQQTATGKPVLPQAHHLEVVCVNPLAINSLEVLHSLFVYKQVLFYSSGDILSSQQLSFCYQLMLCPDLCSHQVLY